jgi:uncharacterized membrane protein
MTTVTGPPISHSQQANQAARSRLQSVDAARGAVIILMALDHIRDFINSSAMVFSPTDLTRTSAGLFLTRWITHFCAPMFAFTAGIGAFLWMRRGRTRGQLSRFLITRGLWLVFLELTVLRFIMFSSIRFTDTLVVLLVIWMLGLCMIGLAALIHLPRRLLAFIAVVIIAGHNLLDTVDASRFGKAAWLWNILHQQGVFRVGSVNFLAAYPLIPWIGVMALGYCFGSVMLWESDRQQRLMLKLGIALTTGFFLLRLWNHYGDPAPWAAQKSAIFSLLSFLNCTKYPPSLAFLLMTLGPGLLAMAWLERVHLTANHPLIVFGRVPFFFYTVHLAVEHIVAILLAWARYGSGPYLWLPPPSMGGPRESFPLNYGFSLWVVYVTWIGVIVMLYPLCRWFARLKQRRRSWWLSYL